MFSCTWLVTRSHVFLACAGGTLSRVMASNVPRSVETVSGREERLRKRKEHDRLRRDQETDEERRARFVNVCNT